MYISYWTPFREVREFQRSRMRSVRPVSRQGRNYPPVDLIDAGDRLIFRAILPGVTADDLHVTVSGDQVVLEGTKRLKPVPDARPIRRERMYGEFKRVIRLPEAIDTDHVEPRHAEGVLILVMPKARLAGPVSIRL